MTKYEIEILRIISESNKHLTADEVYESVKVKYPSMVKASSYNNLNKLTFVLLKTYSLLPDFLLFLFSNIAISN